MSNALTTTEALLIKKIRRLVIAISILLLLFIAGLFFLFFKSNEVKFKANLEKTNFVGPVSDRTANIGIRNFHTITRHTDLGDYKGVWFDTADINNFMRYRLDSIIARHTEHQKANGIDIEKEHYHWKIGFYWLAKKDRAGQPITPGLSFYVVPILVNESGEVLDYFDTGNLDYYAHPSGTTTSKEDEEDDSNVYDEGHLWP